MNGPQDFLGVWSNPPLACEQTPGAPKPQPGVCLQAKFHPPPPSPRLTAPRQTQPRSAKMPARIKRSLI